MTPYLIIIFLSLLLTYFDFVNLESKGKLYFYLPLVLLLVAMVAFRPEGVDRDYADYKLAYNSIQYRDWSDFLTAYSDYNMELGFLFMMKVLTMFGAPYQVFLIFFELLLGLLLYRFIFKYSRYPFVSVFIYVCFYYFLRDFTQIRFGLSAVLVMNGLMLMAGKQRLSGWTCLIFAGLIHNTGWIGILVVIFAWLPINKWVYVIVAPLGFIISLVNPIGLILRLVGLPEQVQRYLNNIDADAGSSILSYVFAYILLVVSLINFEELMALYGDKFRYIYVSMAVAIFVGSTFSTFQILQRLGACLLTLFIIWIPMIAGVFNHKKAFAVKDIFVTIVLLLFLYYGTQTILVNKLLNPYFD